MMIYSIRNFQGKNIPPYVDENRGAHFCAMISFFLQINMHTRPGVTWMISLHKYIQFFVQHQVATSRKLYGIIDDGRISVRDASYGSDGYTQY